MEYLGLIWEQTTRVMYPSDPLSSRPCNWFNLRVWSIKLPSTPTFMPMSTLEIPSKPSRRYSQVYPWLWTESSLSTADRIWRHIHSLPVDITHLLNGWQSNKTSSWRPLCIIPPLHRQSSSLWVFLSLAFLSHPIPAPSVAHSEVTEVNSTIAPATPPRLHMTPNRK